MNILKKIPENILDKFTVEYVRNQVLKNAYGNNDTVIAKLDPRILLGWYMFFSIIPWFIDNVIFLFGLFLFVAITTRLAKMAPLLLFLFSLGVFFQTGHLFLVSLFFDGDLETLHGIAMMMLRVTTSSLASITVFSGLDPDRLSKGLLWLGIPERVSFSISFGYRIMPIIMEEFQNILFSYRLRGKFPDKKGMKGKIRFLCYQIKIIMDAFYPLLLNTAKRCRTTVEALELKGYRYAANNKKVKKLMLRDLKVTNRDFIFLGISALWVLGAFLISTQIYLGGF